MSEIDPSRNSTPRPTERDAGTLRDERFLALYNIAHPRIYAFIFSLLPNHSDAQDALQETSLILLRRFDDFQAPPDETKSPIEAFVKWGCGIAYNQVRRLRRRQSQTIEFSDQVVDRIAEASRRHSSILELRRRYLAECIDRLSESDRELIVQRFRSPTTIKAVAEQSNRSVNAVYKAFNRIRAMLKRCVDLALRQEEDA